jgi:hypothetical protein
MDTRLSEETTHVTEINTWAGQANVLGTELNTAHDETLAARDETYTARTEAENSATQALNSANAAAASALEAASLVESYQGALSADPTLDKNGNPLTAGDWYINTTTGFVRAYNGSAWVQGISVVAGVSSINGLVGDLTGFVTETSAQTEFGLGGSSLILNTALSPNDYPLGSFNAASLSESEAVSIGFPALGGDPSFPRHWDTITFGISTRATQIATEVFGSGTTRGRTFVRVKHDATWHPWVEFLRLRDTVTDNLRDNIVLNAFRIAENNGLTVQGMIDGVIDTYADGDGIDWILSSNVFLQDGFIINNGWDVSTASYASKSFSVAGLETDPKSSVFFNPDGTKMYIVGTANDTIYQYTLNTAWDVSTASYASKSFSVAGQETDPQSVFFNPDGTKMYIVGLTNDTIYQYTLNTAWDVSTASYASKSFSVAGQDTDPKSVFFNPDGTKMYIAGLTNDTIYQYTLNTAWDVSTASYASKSFSVAGQETYPKAVFFNPDGTKMYIAGAIYATVYQYTLNTAWDVSTASYASKSFSVAGQETDPQSVFFNPDGTKMYIVGTANDTIYQYTLIAENLCLISVVESALSTPESGYIVLQMEEVTPSIILNTDLVVAISRDGGTTFTDGTLSLAANIETQKILVADSVDLSSQPSGTSMVSKISLLNNKQAKIHGICMEWS